MNKKRFWILALVFIMALSLISCEEDRTTKAEDPDDLTEEAKGDETDLDDNEEVDKDDNEDLDEVASEDIFEGEVNLYFANAEYINTGDEDLERLILEKREITSQKEDLAGEIIDQLIAGPSDDSKYNLIPEAVKILDVENIDNIAHVNLSSDNLNGGSMEESFLIEQIVNSLLDLDDVHAVMFLIDGEVSESLMGHVDTSKAFTSKFKY